MSKQDHVDQYDIKIHKKCHYLREAHQCVYFEDKSPSSQVAVYHHLSPISQCRSQVRNNLRAEQDNKKKKQSCVFGFADEPLETLRWMASWLAARPGWVDPRFSQPDPGETRRSAARTHKSPRPHGWLWRGISSGSYSEKQVHISHHHHQSLITKGKNSMRHWSVASNAATLLAYFLSN